MAVYFVILCLPESWVKQMWQILLQCIDKVPSFAWKQIPPWQELCSLFCCPTCWGREALQADAASHRPHQKLQQPDMPGKVEFCRVFGLFGRAALKFKQLWQKFPLLVRNLPGKSLLSSSESSSPSGLSSSRVSLFKTTTLNSFSIPSFFKYSAGRASGYIVRWGTF